MKHRLSVKYRLFRKPLVILQIHETRNHTASVGGQIEDWQSEHWRNATPDDLICLKVLFDD
jgi:hypothetical protein